MIHRNIPFLILIAAATSSLSGCATPQGDTNAEKVADVQQMRAETLEMVYNKMPQMKDTLAEAPGYGAFSAVSTHSIIMATGNGFGVIHDNVTGADTYMRALKLGAGFGAGAQTVRAIVVFNDAQTMHNVLDHGWSLNGRAEAAVKAGDIGDSAAIVIALPGMSIYRFAQNGVMVGGAIEGAKVWKDKELN
ncbi:MAG: hypothetical protein IT445_02990 [Phycisphaeraceae bacterium]|nr:hypothetical protein [Phycisphaeraceae bacterium]